MNMVQTHTMQIINVCMCIRWADVTISETILRELFPGQVTAVFTRKEALNVNLNPGTSLVGVRIPDHQFIRQLVGCCPFALALTSANKSGNQSTLEVKVILLAFLQVTGQNSFMNFSKKEFFILHQKFCELLKICGHVALV